MDGGSTQVNERSQPLASRGDPEGRSTPERDEDAKLSGRDGEDESPQHPMPRWKKLLLVALGLAVLTALVTGGVLYWLSARHYESTDDAFVDGHTSQVAAQVSGRVLRLGFADNQDVRAGDVLVEIDPRDLQVRLDQVRAQRANAVAQLAQVQAQLATQQANADGASATLRVSESDLAKAQRDLARYRGVSPAAIARQQVDDAEAATRSAVARLEASLQAALAAAAQVKVARAQSDGAVAQLAAADADVANAELQLSYAHVRAPVDGRATKRSVELGNYVTPGLSLLSVVAPDVWVTANFKESQTGDMHAGQPVEIRLDQYPHLRFQGRVDSFQNGTGSAFSSLPAENATGNYVKVVQRVPVKITFDPRPPGAPADLRLSPGLSAVPRVTVR